ncbi:MAG: hypothetical protein ACFNXT_02450, partial [Actinomyces massiliensis]
TGPISSRNWIDLGAEYDRSRRVGEAVGPRPPLSGPASPRLSCSCLPRSCLARQARNRSV